VRLSSIREQARAVYNLSDEGVEDWRANLRGQSPFLASETRALLNTVHFQPTEIARLHGEFMFARAYHKSCERLRLRGLREEFVDGLLAREFPMVRKCCCLRVAFRRTLLTVLYVHSFHPSLRGGLSTCFAGMPTGTSLSIVWPRYYLRF
jgi:hypothetical protein